MRTEGLDCFKTRCIMKLTYIAGDDPEQDYIHLLKAFFKQIKRVVDNKIIILLWFNQNNEVEPIILLL